MIDSLRAEQRPFLHLDLGDFAKIDEVSGAIETSVIWDVLEKTGVQAIGVGPRELSNWATMEELKNRGTIPLISSNLTVKRDGNESPVGLPYEVFTVNRVKVAVFSLMGGAELSSARPPQGVEFGFSDPIQRAVDLVPQLRGKADLVVLMSQMSTSDTDRLVQAVPGIDVALYGQRPNYTEIAQRKGHTICNETGTRGQQAGVLVLIVDPEGQIAEFGSQNRELTESVAEDQEVVRLINDTNEKSKKLREDARKAREAEVQKKLTGELYLGDETCRSCHGRQYDQWASSPHARAFATLQQPLSGKAVTPECVACHVTGYGEGGFVPDAQNPAVLPATSPSLANVQCEACHGVGTRHQRTGTVEVPESVCRTCHTTEWSPGFDYPRALEAVRHISRG